MDTIVSIAADNAVADAKELAEELGRQFKDSDVAEYTRKGINLVAAAERFVETYSGTNSFMTEMKHAQEKYKSLSTGRARAALNIMRQEHLGLAPKVSAREERVYACFKCNHECKGITALNDHKRVCPGKSGAAPTVSVVEEEEEEVPVIAVTTSTLNLDLSDLPNGRYAVPDLNNERDNDFLFFSVTRTKKDKNRDRRYRYGKIVTGWERVPAGTIELKEWSSDSKRLFGQQVPGDVYKGEFEQHITMILAAPETWARIFGQMIGRCFRCGKKLTDELSRDRGFGPECAKHLNEYRRP